VKPRVASVDEVQRFMSEQAYLADRGLATAIYLSLSLERPLLLEGEAGVGKTEVGIALASALGAELVRLQCYEGIDASQALYEWDYARQLLHARALSEREAMSERALDELFSPRFLVERPLLHALRRGDEAVLLIDEVDRADDEFEAFLLEVLSDFQVTIPEIGPLRAESPPPVILTSNRTRELHDALKRRCLYHWIEYPELEREVEIVRVRAPEVPKVLSEHVAGVVARIRALDLYKPPGVAETIDWARAIALLGGEVTPDVAGSTLGSLLKDHQDLDRVRDALPEVIGDG
jgi:MoxR-like ATPase